MRFNFNTKADKVLAPTKSAHVVLRTNQFEDIVTFYKVFLGAEVIYRKESLHFLRRRAPSNWHQEQRQEYLRSGTHRIHFQYYFRASTGTSRHYRQRKDSGIDPRWPVNYGPTTSIYYKDPDGNMIETRVDNFEDPERRY
jgi:catechol 2,3-dioxygenase-like lactoylglutathione lyase family enzyme